MLTKINIISCETCGRIVTRSRIDGFPSYLAGAPGGIHQVSALAMTRVRRF